MGADAEVFLGELCGDFGHERIGRLGLAQHLEHLDADLAVGVVEQAERRGKVGDLAVA